MEKVELDYELLKEIQDKVTYELDKDIILFLMKNKNKRCSIDDMIVQLNLTSFEDNLFDTYSDIQVLKGGENIQYKEEDECWHHLTEYDKYEEFLRNLSKNSFLSSEILDGILKIQYIDTRQSYWHEVSEKLQECFSCLNYELFLKNLKIHFKLISSQNSSVDGYLSLLKGTSKIVISYSRDISNNQMDISNNRVFLCLKMIITTELFMLNSIHTSKDEIIEEVIENLIALFSYRSNNTEKNIVILDYISILDEKANWFKYLCSSGYTISILFKKLEKFPLLFETIFENFLKPMKDLVNTSNFIITNLYNHNCCFLIYYFSHYCNKTNFVIKNSSREEYTFSSIISLIVLTINSHSCNDLREKLMFFVTTFFEENPNLINQNILEILFTPFENIMKGDSIKIIISNAYLFKLIRLAAKIDERILTNGYLYNKRKYKNIFHLGSSNNSLERSNSNIPQLIIDITILMLRNYINTSEKTQIVDNLVLTLMDCCENIYDSHPVFLFNSITSKFILNLKSFYKVLCNFNSCKQESEKTLSIFKFFFKYFSNISSLLNDGLFTATILNNILSRNINLSDLLIFHNLSHEVFIQEELETQLHLIAQTFLINVCEERIYSNKSEFDKEFLEFTYFVTILSYNEKLIKMFVMDPREYEFMGKNSIIKTMLKISVQSKSNTLDDYAGLLMVKILISNLDGLVFFQEIFNLKNDLCRAQTQIDTECENDLSSPTFLSKKCSILRKNILSYLDATGYPNKELNVLCDDIHLEEKEVERAVRILGKKNTPPCDFQKFLFKSRDAVHDRNWINQVRRHFQKYCQLDYKVSLVFEILNQISKVFNKEIILRIWPESNRWLPKLNVEETIAISIVVKFGMQSQLLNLGYKHEENLGILLKQSRIFLNLPLEESDGFDWFIGICFLICSGNLEKCKTFIMNIANLPSASLIWYKFGKVHGSFWIENFMQHLDVLLAENTTIYTALKMISLSPTIIMKKLLTQCFFNILDFYEICNFIIFSTIHPLECSLYYVLCLFIHNKKNICTLSHDSSLENLLNVISLEDFKLDIYYPVIQKYRTKYKNIIKL